MALTTTTVLLVILTASLAERHIDKEHVVAPKLRSDFPTNTSVTYSYGRMDPRLRHGVTRVATRETRQQRFETIQLYGSTRSYASVL